MNPPCADDDTALVWRLGALSSGEVAALWLRLRGQPRAVGPWLARSPEGPASAMQPLLDALPAASEAQRGALHAALQRATAPLQRRAAPVHHLHALSCLRQWGCAPQDLALRRWLVDGADPGEEPLDLARQRWLRRCVLQFPVGPTHLRGLLSLPAPSAEVQLTASALCLLSLNRLLGLLPRLGVWGLIAPFRDPYRDETAARALARLPAHLGPALADAQRAAAHLDPALSPSLRAMGRGLVMYAAAYATDLDTLLHHLGASLLGVAACGRFALDGQHLALRLPPPLSASLRYWIGRAPRSPHPLRLAIRHHCLRVAAPDLIALSGYPPGILRLTP
jgi:hypothetical protein